MTRLKNSCFGIGLKLLDVGDGKEINLDKCPRMKLQHQCIKYLRPKERTYEVVVENGKFVYKVSLLTQTKVSYCPKLSEKVPYSADETIVPLTGSESPVKKLKNVSPTK